MAAPGWYPDPESMTRERYWDGDAWSTQVRESGTQVRPAMPGVGEDPPTVVGRVGAGEGAGGSEPFSPFRPSVPLPDLDDQTRLPPPPPAPPPVAGPGAPGRAGYVAPGSSTGGTRRTGVVVGIVVAAVVVVGGGLAAFLVLGGDDESDPSAGTSPSASPATPSASPRLADLCGSGDALEDVPDPGDGRVHGGGLSFEAPAGFTPGEDAAFAYSFTTDPSTVLAAIAGTDYATTYTVAALDRSTFGTPQEAVEAVLGCYATGRFYDDPPAFYTPGEQADLTVGGRPAVSMQGDFRLDGAAIPGGDVRAIVVDTDDPDTYGLFVSDHVLDDDAATAVTEQVIDGLQVD